MVLFIQLKEKNRDSYVKNAVIYGEKIKMCNGYNETFEIVKFIVYIGFSMLFFGLGTFFGYYIRKDLEKGEKK